MNVLIKNSAKDMIVVVRSTLEVVLSHLEQSFGAQILTADDRDRIQGLQSLLCGNLQVKRRNSVAYDSRLFGLDFCQPRLALLAKLGHKG